MTWYAIRHIPSGCFLPEIGCNYAGMKRGYTATEPSSKDLYFPRVFASQRAARNALTVWLKGVQSVSRYQDADGEYDERWHLDVRPERRREEMEVVQVNLEIIGCLG